MKKQILGALLGSFSVPLLQLSVNSGMPQGKGKREKQGKIWGRPGAKIIRKFHSGIAGLTGKTRHDRDASGNKLPF
ncbi:MAG: hypothetical protein KF908_05375 [Nitrosomonas sp.]|nr:hypothetical protein [Nitrosomonas sp.]